MLETVLGHREKFHLPSGIHCFDENEHQSIIAVSSTLYPKPIDLPERFQYLPAKTNIFDSEYLGKYSPSEAFLNFLQLSNAFETLNESEKNKEKNRIPVIYIGLGSMPLQENEQRNETLANDLLEIVEEMKIRLVLSGRAMKQIYEKMCQTNKNKQQFSIHEFIWFENECPHAWLFKRINGVIYHGGIGTTMTVLAAGTPCAIYPIGFDQPYWSHRLHEMVYSGVEERCRPEWKIVWAVSASGSDFRQTFQFLLSNFAREKFSIFSKNISCEGNSTELGISLLYKFYNNRKLDTARKLGIIPQWNPSEKCIQCQSCQNKFGLTKWKYQCYACGKFICSNCRAEKSQHISTFGNFRPCQNCAKIYEENKKLQEKLE